MIYSAKRVGHFFIPFVSAFDTNNCELSFNTCFIHENVLKSDKED